MTLSRLERPFICTSLAASTLEGTISALERAEYDGASAFEVHLPLLDFPDDEEIAELTAATSRPMYATCRRDAFYTLLGDDVEVALSDEERVEALLSAVEAGFDGIDVELDTFAPTPKPEDYSRSAIEAYADDDATPLAEVADEPDAVERQRSTVEAVHDRGGEVILSAHTYKHLAPGECVAIAERMTDRGADFGKIVGVDRTMDEALETLEAHLRLNEAGVLPYALMAIGETSRITRPLAPMFGSAWVFAQPELTPGGFHDWPLVENAREVLRRIDWRTAHDPHGASADRT